MNYYQEMEDFSFESKLTSHTFSFQKGDCSSCQNICCNTVEFALYYMFEQNQTNTASY